MKINVGLQIYTLRDEIGLGYETIFKRIAEIGYTGVEMTYSPDNVDEFRKLLKKYNLKATGAHIGIYEIENKLNAVMKFMDAIGAKSIVIPHIGETLMDSEEKTKETAKRFEAAAKKLAELGYEVCFHNQTYEFATKYNGKTVIDIFYDEAPSLKFEVDVGWAYACGADVPAVLKKLGKRLAFIHVKDIDEKGVPTEIGSGKVDMKTVINTVSKLGVEWGIVEQDTCLNYKPFDAIKISYDYVKTIN
jgi:sugar phosphate isomerase/epimerase